MRQRRRTIFLVLLVSILALVIVQQQRYQSAGENREQTTSPGNETSGKRSAPSNKTSQESPNNNNRRDSKSSKSSAKQDRVEFNRKLDKIIYSRHGRCRMDCRNIDEYEIKEIRDKGKINWEKSDPDAERDPRFALEGITRDNQLVRVVFAQTKDALVLVTCIDLKTDWTCHCN